MRSGQIHPRERQPLIIFPGDDEEGEIVGDEDDEMRTTVNQQIRVAAVSIEKPSLFELRIYS